MAKTNNEGEVPLTQHAIDWLKSEVDVLSPREKNIWERRAKYILECFTEKFGQYIPEEKLNSLERKKLYERIVIVNDEDFVTTYDIVDRKEIPKGSMFSELGVRYYTRETMETSRLTKFNNSEDEAYQFYKGLVDKYGEDMHRFFFGADLGDDVKQKILSDIEESKLKAALPSLSDSYENHFNELAARDDPLIDLVRGASFDPDLLIIIKDHRNYFYTLSEASQKQLIDTFQTEEKAREMVELAYMNEHVAHEMIHLFESN